MEDSERLKKLDEALQKRGFWNPYNVFNHQPDVIRLKDNKRYEYLVEIHK